MKRPGFTTGAAIGAAAAYAFDPERGRRRRALARDQVIHLSKKAQDMSGATSRDIRNRLTGISAEARSVLDNEPADSRVLEERVRSRIGGACSHPGAIRVEAREDGSVVLHGDVLAAEVVSVVQRAERTRGVRFVENNLRVHQDAGQVSALQGPGRIPQRRRWSPAMRASALGGGVMLILRGMAKRGVRGVLSAVAGTAIAMQGAEGRRPQILPTNLPKGPQGQPAESAGRQPQPGRRLRLEGEATTGDRVPEATDTQPEQQPTNTTTGA